MAKSKEAITEEQMKCLLAELKCQYDFILLDCPAGIEQGFKNAIAGADEALVICTPEVSSVRDADRVIGLMAANEISKINLIINRIRPDLVRSGDMLTLEDVEDILGQKAIGAVRDDASIVKGTNLGEAAVNIPSSKAGKEYENIAKRIIGEKIPVTTKKPLETLINKIFSKKTAV